MAKHLVSKKNRIFTIVLTLVVFLAAAIYIIFNLNNDTAEAQPAIAADIGSLNVQFIDVGQADSTLVMLSTGETMLIDAGESRTADAVFDEIDERGIKDIDILVATHPHNDHIGGMRSIVERYDVGLVLLPNITSDTKTYTNLIDAINKKEIPVVEGFAGYRFSLGGAKCTVVSPNADDNKDANNESIVIYLDYGNTDFLFTGDMEEWAEDRVLESNYYIDADVLKVAHHGSDTGSSDAFLSKVTPDYAVISCGRDNDYGHPHAETLERLRETGAAIYRTDIQGDILFISDGQTLTTITGD